MGVRETERLRMTGVRVTGEAEGDGSVMGMMGCVGRECEERV